MTENQLGPGEGPLELGKTTTRQLKWTPTYTFSHPGLLVLGEMPLRLYNDTDYDLTITKIRLTIATKPTNGATRVDIWKNGVSIFNPNWGANINGSVPQIAPTDPPSRLFDPIDNTWLRGDYLTLAVLSTGSPNPGSNMTLQISTET